MFNQTLTMFCLTYFSLPFDSVGSRATPTPDRGEDSCGLLNNFFHCIVRSLSAIRIVSNCATNATEFIDSVLTQEVIYVAIVGRGGYRLKPLVDPLRRWLRPE